MDSENGKMIARLPNLTDLDNLDALWNPLEAVQSEAAFRARLPLAESREGNERYHLLLLLTWIGRAEAHQGKFQEARVTLEKVEEFLDEAEATYPVSLKIRWLLERGRLYVLDKTPAQARVLFSEGWTLALNSGEDSLAIEIAQMMAVNEPQKVQQEWINRAIEIAENSPAQKSKQWLGRLYTTLGWKLFDLRQYDKSLEAFQKALRNLKAQGIEREAFVAQWSIGKVLRAQGKTEEALTIQKTLLSELGIGGRRDGRLYEELAECLQTLRRTTEAQLYFELAYRELSADEWISDNQPLRLKRMKDLGKTK